MNCMHELHTPVETRFIASQNVTNKMRKTIMLYKSRSYSRSSRNWDIGWMTLLNDGLFEKRYFYRDKYRKCDKNHINDTYCVKYGSPLVSRKIFAPKYGGLTYLTRT